MEWISPFPVARVFLAGLEPVPVQQPARFAESVYLQRLLGQIDFRRVEQAPRLLLALDGLSRLRFGTLLLRFGMRALFFLAVQGLDRNFT